MALSACVLYQDHLYVIYGWSAEEGGDLNTVMRTSLTSGPPYDWTTVELAGDFAARDSFGYALRDSVVYMFGGYAEETQSNALVTLDLSRR